MVVAKLTHRMTPLPAGFGAGRWGKISRLSEVCRIYKVQFPLSKEQMIAFTHLELEQIRNIILQHKGNSEELRKFIATRGNDNAFRKGRTSSPRYSKVFISN